MRNLLGKRGDPTFPIELFLLFFREAKEQEKQLDHDWYVESLRLQRAMAQTELDEQTLREQLRQEQLGTLREQSKQAAVKKMNEKTDRFGTIGNDFFAQFGTSCR